MLTFDLLSSIKVNFSDFVSIFLWVLGRPNQGSYLQFCYLNLFYMLFQRLVFVIYPIQIGRRWAFCKIYTKFGQPKMLSWKREEIQAKWTQIWDHQGQKSQLTKCWKKNICKRYSEMDENLRTPSLELLNQPKVRKIQKFW